MQISKLTPVFCAAASSTLQIELLITQLFDCAAAEPDFLSLAHVAQEQTENALCHQAPDRRTSEQL